MHILRTGMKCSETPFLHYSATEPVCEHTCKHHHMAAQRHECNSIEVKVTHLLPKEMDTIHSVTHM